MKAIPTFSGRIGLPARCRLLAALCLVLFGLASCSENIDEENEYVNWKARNSEAFLLRLNEAKAAVAQAKATYGDDWEEHCRWRVYRTYALGDESPATAADSVCVEILERGTGSGCPLYTDSVRVNYIGRVISTDLSRPLGTLGEVFDHSGMSDRQEDVFSPDFAMPATLLTSNLVEGFTTVLQQMHIGDLWRAYIPQELGYGAASSGRLPAYSTLIFDIQLKAYYRAGTVPSPW